MNQWAYAILFTVGFIGFLFFVEWIHRYYITKVEYTRKLAHSFACLSSMLFVLFFESTLFVVLMGILFFLILFIGKHYHLFNSIDKIERKSIGSFLLPISIGTMFYISRTLDSDLLFILPILVLGISDPLAGISGSLSKSKLSKIILFNNTLEKTYFGSGLFFISALLLSAIVLFVYSFSIVEVATISLLIAAVSTAVELLSIRGIDNITIPLSIASILYLCQ
ncbi:MAG: hypothetical protein ACOYOA_09190 [Saprospiraceae bacterium]